MRYLIIILLFAVVACNKHEPYYSIRSQVVNESGTGIEQCAIIINQNDTIYTNSEGFFNVNNLKGTNQIKAFATQYEFSPNPIEVYQSDLTIQIVGTRVITQQEQRIINWFNQVQLPNGLMPSVENGTVISLYDNALAALVFIAIQDSERAEQIFDFFESKRTQELTNGVGGFSQFRNQSGVPNNHRWMGDNAWLLLALNNYHAATNSTKYTAMASELENWLLSLQDTDGGLFAGYNAANDLLNYKVTEGVIDAFCAISGYSEAHKNMLTFLKTQRWDAQNQSLTSWPDNPPYLYALDVHSWSYLIFQDFPAATLTFANRFLTTQTAENGNSITGYCFDDDKDVVWLEGTAQICLALGEAGLQTEKNYYLNQLERTYIENTNNSNSGGFPYATNLGTAYGNDLLWEGSTTKSAVSTGAWYLFAQLNFNPFKVGKTKSIPLSDQFWVTP